jgi:hypothetical protein
LQLQAMPERWRDVHGVESHRACDPAAFDHDVLTAWAEVDPGVAR